jgi:peptidoglycan/xylan/chitin deacetylase (PgdA/CDA1 family)
VTITVAFTVDLESDCPPYLNGYRGIEQGLPSLLGLLSELAVPATFFTTGDVATRFPRAVDTVVSAGHELACHGMTHTAFTTLDVAGARTEIEQSAAILRDTAPVTSFRAPYLQFPHAYVPMLEDAGFSVDSSQAKYKLEYYRTRNDNGAAIRRIPASVTSSVLRLAKPVRTAYLALLDSPVVLFVHPWEFVDLTRERLRVDCRFKTGAPALAAIGDVLRSYQARGARFVRMRELASCHPEPSPNGHPEPKAMDVPLSRLAEKGRSFASLRMTREGVGDN